MLLLAKGYYKDNPKISFMCGYSLQITGMVIAKDLSYEDKIKIFYNACKNFNIEDATFSRFIIFMTSERKTNIIVNDVNTLFPNNTILDNYFRGIILNGI